MENNALDMNAKLKSASYREHKALKEGICKSAQFWEKLGIQSKLQCLKICVCKWICFINAKCWLHVLIVQILKDKSQKLSVKEFQHHDRKNEFNFCTAKRILKVKSAQSYWKSEYYLVSESIVYPEITIWSAEITGFFWH